MYHDLREVYWWNTMKKRYPHLFESREIPDLGTNPFLVFIYKLACLIAFDRGVFELDVTPLA